MNLCKGHGKVLPANKLNKTTQLAIVSYRIVSDPG